MNWTDNLGKAELPRVLVACPTYDGVGYALNAWADAYKAFDYPHKGALQVDNSDANLHYTHLVRAQGIPCIYQTRRFDYLWDTLELSWTTIVEYAHQNGYALIASIEADMVCPPETLRVLVEHWLDRGPKAVIAHRYHPRGLDNPPAPPEGMVVNEEALAKYREECWFDTLGCTLFPTELLHRNLHLWKAVAEREFFQLVEEEGYERVRLRDLLDVKHLDDPEKMVKGTVNFARMQPAELSVKQPEQPKGAWHGRRDGQPGTDAVYAAVPTPEAPVKDPAAAEQAKAKMRFEASRVSGWECTRCGKCCTEFVMYSSSDGAKDFWDLRGFKTRKMDDGRVEVKMDAICEWLEWDGETASCKDYENRPPTCRNYRCEVTP